MMAVSLGAAFHLTRPPYRSCAQDGGGPLVYVSSINGRGKVRAERLRRLKGRIHGLAKTVAREVERFGIRINVVAPGIVQTPMTDALPEGGEAGGRDGNLPGTSRRTRGRRASVIAFLVSPADGHITGQVIRVDRGQYL